MDVESLACESPEVVSVELDKTVPRRPRFRFLIRRTVLVPLAVMAVFCSAWLGPVWLMLMTVIFASLAWPAVLIVVLVCGRGYQRAFCIAALYPAVTVIAMAALPSPFWIVAIFGDGTSSSTGTEGALWYCFAGPLAMSCACGGLGMLTRWIFTAQERH